MSKPIDRLESGLEEIAENHMEDIEEEDEEMDDESYELRQMISIYEDERDSVGPLGESASISGDEAESSATPHESWPRGNRRGSSSITMSEFEVSTGDYSSTEFDFPDISGSGIPSTGDSGEILKQAPDTASKRPSVSSSFSAPEQQTGRYSPLTDGVDKRSRRVSISLPSSSAELSAASLTEDQPLMGPGHMRKQRQHSKRRQSVSISINSRSIMGDSADLDNPDDTTSSSTSGKTLLGRKSMRRQSVSHRSLAMSSMSVNSGNPFESIDSAMESLGQEQNEVMSVAAAAAVVAAGATAGGKRSRTQYSTGDKVLVFVNILNHTNNTDSKEDFTIAPVNKAGFPEGEGNASDQVHGPWSYVLATVQRVHFDEDFPYYTVIREDTGSAQRADAGWMEPLKSREGQEAAIAAAKRTGRAKEQNVKEKESRNLSSFLVWLKIFFMWPKRFATTTLIPFYQRARLATKVQIARVLFGEAPYACKLRVTGVNLLVVCSFCYLFIEVIQHAFLPASWDYALTVVSLIVWIILALELFFEWWIRPAGYFDLISSDKAYAPSTARHINRYHLTIELLALLLFIPSFLCIGSKECSRESSFSNLKWSVVGVIGASKSSAALGRFCLGLTGLRMFGLVRHWKKMWINNAFDDIDWKKKNRGTLGGLFTKTEQGKFRFNGRRKAKVEDEDIEETEATKPLGEEDLRLKKAATIGTALMIVNSHRTMVILMVIMIVLPTLLALQKTNPVALKLAELLQANNIALNLTKDSYEEMECAYLENAVTSWLSTVAKVQSDSSTEHQDTYVLWAQLLPVRCDFQEGGSNTEAGVITDCALWNNSISVWGNEFVSRNSDVCAAWNTTPTEPYTDFFADELNIRSGGIFEYHESAFIGGEEFSVKVLVNHNNVVSLTNCAFFLMLLTYLLLTIGGLTVLRGDAGRLVLDPLQRMLKIVLRYAENPLAQTPQLRKPKLKKGQSSDFSNDPWGTDSGLGVEDKDQLGNYETEQLINAITKIADLLRKCWGVAGADIITSNLDRTQDGKPVVFNPTVPGKRVYALFGFVGISGFGEVLHAIDKDVMILINDVAKVVHDEVYRWALGDSGQCNKNLGSTFLMVYRIGDFDEVHEKKRLATDVVFDSKEKGNKKSSRLTRRRHQGLHRRHQSKKKSRAMQADDTLQLSTLPGIQRFTDRALLGMLKAFAALHRDREVQAWKKDFRLGCGVGVFTVEILIGMDAGWAVEGAVGSEYKIDATYLSPHVNMASRMMSATKQYGVTLLMSQAVEELLSLNARAKLRHLDTVYVKGSQVKQRIFTYDARHQGVDFFLFETSEEQSDLDADNYTPSIWDNDQDLKSMRQHVTAEFSKKFAEGVKFYLTGKWKDAIESLNQADDIMIETVLEEGYIDYNPDAIDPRMYDRACRDPEIVNRRHALGDGACRVLISFMENRGGVPPSTWDAVRPLTSK